MNHLPVPSPGNRNPSHSNGAPELNGHQLSGRDAFLTVPLSRHAPEIVREFCQRLAKVELHYHLEGGLGVSPEALLELSRRHGFALPAESADELQPFVQVTADDRTLLDFLRKFETIGSIFVSRALIADLTEATVRAAAEENVAYLELRYSPTYMTLAHGVSLEDVMEGVLEGASRGAAATGMRVNHIVIIERQMALDIARSAVDLAIQYKERGVVAVDLANDEFNYPPGPFAELFQHAKRSGLAVTIHAGEAAGPENIRIAVEELWADRIGHGVRAHLDPEVVTMLRDRGIPLELCPTSNVQTQAVESLELHPLRRYFDHGLKVTVNTDDAGICATTLTDEFHRVITQFGFSVNEVRQLLMHAVDGAFVDDEYRTELRALVETDFENAVAWLRESDAQK